jgi:hypothetical protein
MGEYLERVGGVLNLLVQGQGRPPSAHTLPINAKNAALFTRAGSSMMRCHWSGRLYSVHRAGCCLA